MSRKLTPRQQDFRTAYIRSKTKNKTEAAKAAGYKNPNMAGSRLAKVPAIKAAIEAHQEVALAHAEITGEKILGETWGVASSDIGEAFNTDGTLKAIRDMPESIRRCIASVEVDEIWEGVGEVRTVIGVTKTIRLWPKVPALELVGKNKKLWDEASPLSGVPMVFNIVPANNFPARDKSH